MMPRARQRWTRAMTTVGIAGCVWSAGVDAQSSWLDPYRAVAARIVTEATSNSGAWDRLAAFTDANPARLSGSPQLEGAIQWAVEQMKRDGLDGVHLEPVMIPHWVRGGKDEGHLSAFSSTLTAIATF